MKRKKKEAPVDPWNKLLVLIYEYGEACRADEMKGGGDPTYMEVVEAEFKLARARVEAHVTDMKRRVE